MGRKITQPTGVNLGHRPQMIKVDARSNDFFYSSRDVGHMDSKHIFGLIFCTDVYRIGEFRRGGLNKFIQNSSIEG